MMQDVCLHSVVTAGFMALFHYRSTTELMRDLGLDHTMEGLAYVHRCLSNSWRLHIPVTFVSSLRPAVIPGLQPVRERRKVQEVSKPQHEWQKSSQNNCCFWGAV